MNNSQTTTMPIVGIIILSWNNSVDTITCLDSVGALDYSNFFTLVVDNGSTDGSVARIRAAFPEVEIYETGLNLGYAEGNNEGIRHVLKRNPDYIFVLNNDTTLEPSMLSRLVDCAETNPSIGMVGPTICFMETSSNLFAAGSFVRWQDGSVEHRGMLQEAGDYIDKSSVKAVDFLAGCGVLVSRQLIDTIGLLDAEYYLNFEDVEWGIRANKQGFQVLYIPQAVMWHKDSGTLGQASPANTYYMTRNALRFFWQNAKFPLNWFVVSRITLRTLRTIGAWSLKKDYREEVFKKKRAANLYALRDFFFGKFGAMGPEVFRICYDD